MLMFKDFWGISFSVKEGRMGFKIDERGIEGELVNWEFLFYYGNWVPLLRVDVAECLLETRNVKMLKRGDIVWCVTVALDMYSTVQSD